MLAHFFLFLNYNPGNRIESLVDSLVFNVSFLLLGLGIWYIVRYNDLGLKNIWNLVFGHMIGAIVLIGLWLWLSSWLSQMIVNNEVYRETLMATRMVRFVSGIMYYLVIILVYYLIIYYQDFRNRIEKEGKILAKSREAELNALKAQINPHFIFNSLNSINSLVLTEPGKAQEMIVKLSDFLRLSLLKNDQLYTSLADELKFSNIYLEIEKIRFGNKLEYHSIIEKGLEDTPVPPFILQPLLENAIKHGVQESIEQVDIRVTCADHEGMLEICVSNSIAEFNDKKGKGIGLNNIKDRLELIYERTDLLTINQTDKSFEVKLNLPYKK